MVGSDGRTSSPAIKNTLVKALLTAGRDVVDIGPVPTPVLYFATHSLDIRSGVMVTGQPQPGRLQRLQDRYRRQTTGGRGPAGLRERMAEGKFSRGAGRLAKQDVVEDYIDAVLGDIAISGPLKIVVDAGNGAAGELARKCWRVSAARSCACTATSTAPSPITTPTRRWTKTWRSCRPRSPMRKPISASPLTATATACRW